MAQSRIPLADYQYLRGIQKHGKTVLNATAKFVTLERLVRQGYVCKDYGKLHRNLQGDPRARDPESLIGQYKLTEAGEAELAKTPPPHDDVVQLQSKVAELNRIVVALAAWVSSDTLESLGLTEQVNEIRARVQG